MGWISPLTCSERECYHLNISTSMHTAITSLLLEHIRLKKTAIVNHPQIKSSTEGASYWFYHTNWVNNFHSDLFDVNYWVEKDAVVGSAKGRGTTWFLKHENENLVLRHYYRGGLVSKLLNDQYLFTGLANTRAYREFFLLLQLNELGLPAPAPVAIQIQRSGLIYRSDILTLRIRNSEDLVSILSASKLEAAEWKKIGATIRQFHLHDIYHHDLNAHNILIDEQGKVWLIDFDQGDIRQNGAGWKANNLNRLKRSFVKEAGKLDKFMWQESDWDALLEGYQEG